MFHTSRCKNLKRLKNTEPIWGHWRLSVKLGSPMFGMMTPNCTNIKGLVWFLSSPDPCYRFQQYLTIKSVVKLWAYGWWRGKVPQMQSLLLFLSYVSVSAKECQKGFSDLSLDPDVPLPQPPGEHWGVAGSDRISNSSTVLWVCHRISSHLDIPPQRGILIRCPNSACERRTFFINLVLRKEDLLLLSITIYSSY